MLDLVVVNQKDEPTNNDFNTTSSMHQEDHSFRTFVKDAPLQTKELQTKELPTRKTKSLGFDEVRVIQALKSLHDDLYLVKTQNVLDKIDCSISVTVQFEENIRQQKIICH